MENFQDKFGYGVWFFPGSGSGLEKIMDPFPVCPERLDPDPVNIRQDPKPWLKWN